MKKWLRRWLLGGDEAKLVERLIALEKRTAQLNVELSHKIDNLASNLAAVNAQVSSADQVSRTIAAHVALMQSQRPRGEFF